MNATVENSGARRFHTVTEQGLDAISLETSDRCGAIITIDAASVNSRAAVFAGHADLSTLIL